MSSTAEEDLKVTDVEDAVDGEGVEGAGDSTVTPATAISGAPPPPPAAGWGSSGNVDSAVSGAGETKAAPARGGGGATRPLGAGEAHASFRSSVAGASVLVGDDSAAGVQGKNVLRKRLTARMFSHDESREEFRFLDYTPITSAPVELEDELRVVRQERYIKLFVCVTVYNEEADELRRTLAGIAANLPALANLGIMWQEVAVCVVVDGRHKAASSLLEFLDRDLKLYDPALCQTRHHRQRVAIHLFEKSVQLPSNPAQRLYYQPLQLTLALKERNGGKLNSHLWFFTGFCNQVVPDWVLLLDVGTQPTAGAIASLCAAMHHNPTIGGVCGEVAVRQPRVYNIIEAAQNFEYKVSHVLDKAMESVFGYISVLPGAFSAFRWDAIQGDPLAAYFFVEESNLLELGPFLANMYLAEDRVLCFEVLAKRGHRWTLHYEAGAVAHTDVPGNLVELIKQRRRWLNGSFFSLVYYVSKFHRFAAGAHSIWRKASLHIQFVHQFATMVLNWFMIGTLYLSFTVIYLSTFGTASALTRELRYLFDLSYFSLMCLQVISGLGGKATNVHAIYYVSALSFGAVMIIAMGLSMWAAVNSFETEDGGLRWWLILAVASTFLAYGLAGLLHGEIFAIVTNFPQYLFMLPTFINMFSTYSFCNMHDISWGTKEGNLTNERRRGVPVDDDASVGGSTVNASGGIVTSASANALIQQVLAMNAGAGEAATEAAATAVAAAGGQGAAGFQAIAISAARKRKADLIEEEIQRDREQAEREYAAFRTRLLALWLISNWTYVTFVVSFNWIDTFAATIAVLIMFTLLYKVCGTVLYVVEFRCTACIHSDRCECCRTTKCMWCPSCLSCWICCRPTLPPRADARRRERRTAESGRIMKTASYLVANRARRRAKRRGLGADAISEGSEEDSSSADERRRRRRRRRRRARSWSGSGTPPSSYDSRGSEFTDDSRDHSSDVSDEEDDGGDRLGTYRSKRSRGGQRTARSAMSRHSRRSRRSGRPGRRDDDDDEEEFDDGDAYDPDAPLPNMLGRLRVSNEGKAVGVSMARRRWAKLKALSRLFALRRRRQQGPMVDLTAVLAEGERTTEAIMQRKDDKVEYTESLTEKALAAESAQTIVEEEDQEDDEAANGGAGGPASPSQGHTAEVGVRATTPGRTIMREPGANLAAAGGRRLSDEAKHAGL